MDAKISDMESTGGIAKEDSAKARRSRVSGIDRALQVIDYLYETGSPAGVYAIAKAIGAPLSTVYVIVDDLVEKNMLSRNSDSSVWLGARLYHYGLAYARSLDFLNVANHEMHNLSRISGETVQVCGRDGDHMLVLAMADGPGHFQVTSRVGTRVPLNWTASGRLLVGHLPEAERLDLFEHCAKSSPTGRAVIDPAVLSASARQALDARLSIQAGESDYAVACVAAPICDDKGACIATISIVLPEQKVSDNPERYTNEVKASAERIETVMGWRSHS
ncbi:DNA-binding transcriptional regulator, IclR family [Phyllobacterium sp. CL33Tsu]|nr:DNA-binding transcriptional regulator, IclR family [Phyllobacterium sp. CL33Tsu]